VKEFTVSLTAGFGLAIGQAVNTVNQVVEQIMGD
jgi:hypothetical protein